MGLGPQVGDGVKLPEVRMADMRRVVLEVLLGPAEGWEVAPGWAGLGQELQPGRQLGRGHLHVSPAVAPVAQRGERVGTVPRQE